MQQEWDDLDRIIEGSCEEIRVSESYNYKLLGKIKKKKQTKNQSYTFAFSLIMAGFLIMFMYTTDMQYKLLDIQYQIKSNVTFIQSNFNILDNFRGE